jgi:FKBP-type peptidyl-prolyl cis-trans isomerase
MTPEGVQYIVQKAGQGSSPKPGDVVVVTYRTSLVDGTQVDAGTAKEVDLNVVRPGIAKVLMMMKPGAKWSVVFPPEAAFGIGGKPPVVGPNQALVAEVELISVK